MAKRESYIRRALDAVVPRPAQNVYRYGAPVFSCAWVGYRRWGRTESFGYCEPPPLERSTGPKMNAVKIFGECLVCKLISPLHECCLSPSPSPLTFLSPRLRVCVVLGAAGSRATSACLKILSAGGTAWCY